MKYEQKACHAGYVLFINKSLIRFELSININIIYLTHQWARNIWNKVKKDLKQVCLKK
jgi:hypothetical protein